MITETKTSPFGYIQNSSQCPYCHGSGELFDKICSKCHGTGFIKKKQSVHVYTTNIQNGQQLIFNGKGYQSKYSNAPDGDLIIELVFQYDQNKFAIQGNTIYEKIEVPYYDCILGTKIKHKFANGITDDIVIPQYSNDGNQVKYGKTFNRMNYIFIVSVKMPTYIRESERKLLESIKKENK
jgi:molecular chaperone DnaJ